MLLLSCRCCSVMPHLQDKSPNQAPDPHLVAYDFGKRTRYVFERDLDPSAYRTGQIRKIRAMSEAEAEAEAAERMSRGEF
jgi:hypothetical protein